MTSFSLEASCLWYAFSSIFMKQIAVMKKISFILILLTNSFCFAQTEVATTPQIVFKLALGETASSNGVTFHFKEVLEDSRCPENAQCVWAGQARVQVHLAGPTIEETEIDVIVGKKDKDVICEADGYVFRAVQLTPYPIAPEGNKNGYVLLILKEKV